MHEKITLKIKPSWTELYICSDEWYDNSYFSKLYIFSYTFFLWNEAIKHCGRQYISIFSFKTNSPLIYL